MLSTRMHTARHSPERKTELPRNRGLRLRRRPRPQTVLGEQAACGSRSRGGLDPAHLPAALLTGVHILLENMLQEPAPRLARLPARLSPLALSKPQGQLVPGCRGGLEVGGRRHDLPSQH